MRALWIGAAALCLGVTALEAQGGPSGSDYRGMSESWRHGFVAGVFSTTYLLSEGDIELSVADERVARCVATGESPWTTEQTTAVVNLFVENHPENWHWPAAILVINALVEACR